MKTTKRLTFLGLSLAIMIILIAFERTLPPIMPPLGKIGLANIVVMYLIIFMGKKDAILAVVLKAVFNFLMRGYLAAFLSLAGGLVSVFIMLILWSSFKDKNLMPIVAISIAGAIGHNVGQLVVASLILQDLRVIVGYLPLVVIFGTIFGAVTGVFLKVVMPVFKRFMNLR